MLIKSIFLEFICAGMTCVRRLLGPVRCRYPIGCTTFTMHRLRTQPIGKALGASLRRLCSCSSWQPLKKDLFE